MGAPGKSEFELVVPLSPSALEAQCRARGIRMGAARCAVARAVAETKGRFDFALVFDRARRISPRISRGTIYASLRRFLDAGVIRAPGGNRPARTARGRNV